MKRTWFKGVRTAEAAKARYRELVKTHHPDAGGDPEELLAIKAEYEDVLERILTRSMDSQFRKEYGIPRTDRRTTSQTNEDAAEHVPADHTPRKSQPKKSSIFDVFTEDEKATLRATAAKAVGRAAESLADRVMRKIIR